eukprot:304723_1
MATLESHNSVFDFALILQQIFKNQIVETDIIKLQDVFIGHTFNKTMLITHVINRYYYNSQQVTNTFNIDSKLHEDILFKYIKKEELESTHFIQIAKIIIKRYYPGRNINTDEFAAIIMNHQPPIDGNLFVKMTKAEFRHKFGNKISNFKPAHAAYIYKTIKKWSPFLSNDNIYVKQQLNWSNILNIINAEFDEKPCKSFKKIMDENKMNNNDIPTEYEIKDKIKLLHQKINLPEDQYKWLLYIINKFNIKNSKKKKKQINNFTI